MAEEMRKEDRKEVIYVFFLLQLNVCFYALSVSL